MRDFSSTGLMSVASGCILLAAILLNVTFASSSAYRPAFYVAGACLVVATVLLLVLSTQKRGWASRSISLVGLLLVAFLAADNVRRVPAVFRSHGPGELFILPDGSVGWVRVVYGLPGAPLLQREGQVRVIVVPTNGEVATSDEPAGGGQDDRFYYQREGHRVSAAVAVPGHPKPNHSTSHTEKCVFVGTTDDLGRSIRAGVPICSPGLTKKSGL